MPVDSRQRARLERNITAFYAFRLLIGLQFLMPIWVIYLTEKRGFSIEQVTLLDAPFWLALVLLEVPTGLIADRFGRRISLLLGALTNTIGITVFAMAANYPLILLSYLVWGAAFTFYSGADAAFLFDTLKALGRQAEYARIFGRSMAFGAATGIVATLSGPLMAARTDLVVPIYASAVSTGLAFIVILGFMYEPPHSHADEGHPGYVASVRLAFGAIWKSPELRSFVPLVAASIAAMSAVFIFGQPYLRGHGVATGDVGWFLVFSQVGAVVASLVAHRIARGLGWRVAFTLLPISAIFVLGGLAGADTLWAFPLIPAGAMVQALYMPMASDYVNQRVDSAHRATVLSFQSLVTSLILAPLELTLGVFAHRQGLPFAFGVGAGFVLVIAVPLLLFWLRTGPPGRSFGRPGVVPEAAPAP